MPLALEGGEENVGKEQDGIKDGTKELSERQVLILRLIEADGTITTRDLTQKTGLSQRTLLRELSALQEKGVLAREGGRKGGRWVRKDSSETLYCHPQYGTVKITTIIIS